MNTAEENHFEKRYIRMCSFSQYNLTQSFYLFFLVSVKLLARQTYDLLTEEVF